MRLSIALRVAFGLGLMGATEAFTPPNAAASIRQSAKLSVGNFGGGSGWENDDFLASLSKPQEQLPVLENELDGALEGTLPPIQPYRGEHDENQGGSRFKAMMEAAQQAKAAGPPSQGKPPVNPYAANPFVPPAINANTNANAQSPSLLNTLDPVQAEQLSVEEQAAMFRQMMEQRQNVNTQSTMPSYVPPTPGPPTMIGGLDAKGRKIGRNRDTDTIANTSDLYFAQLKRDSSVRNMARLQGDDEYADQVFGDPSVKELEAELSTNPYLQREKDENKDLFQAMAEEMKQLQIRQAASQPDAKDTGPKYRAIMASKKGTNSEAGVPSAPATTPPAPMPVPAAAVSIPVPMPVPVLEPDPIVVAAPIPAPVPQPAPVVVATITEPIVTAIPSPVNEPMEETELTKRKIRELQGLFLKHRGGPGFGSGILRGNEVRQFEDTLKAVGAQLRADAGPRTETASTVPMHVPVPDVIPQPAATTVSAPIPAQPPQVNSPPARAEHPPLITPPPRPDSSAMTTFTPSSVDPRLQGSLACVEGALQMYKNCPPEIQQGMLMALRAALLSAANTCQQVIEGGVDETTTFSPSPISYAAASSNAQDATIEESGEEQQHQQLEHRAVIVQDKVEVVQSQTENAVSTGNDSNTVLLRKVYKSLRESSGDGKYGLGPISADEASDLADLITDMRAVLMEELDSGIPNDVPPPLSVTSSTACSSDSSTRATTGSSSSKYQEMLAKARSENKAN